MLDVGCFFSSAPSSPADFKETLECLGKRFQRAQAQRVHRSPVQRLVELCETVSVEGGKAFAHGGTMGIEFHDFARLGIFNREQAGIRQAALARIMQMQADEIVPSVGDAKFLDDITLLEFTLQRAWRTS